MYIFLGKKIEKKKKPKGLCMASFQIAFNIKIRSKEA